MKKLPRPGFGMRLLSSLLCIILFVSLLAGILIADIRIITTKENTSKIIRESLFTSHTVRPAAARPGTASGHGASLPVRVRYAMPKLAEEDTTGIMTDALVEFVYDSMTEQYGELPITLEDVEDFIEESTLKDDISDLSASLINDLVTGENTTVIDEEMVTGLVMENADLIETYFGVTMDEAAISQMAGQLVASDVVADLQENGISQVLLDSMTGGSAGSDDSADENVNQNIGNDSADSETIGGDHGNVTTPGGSNNSASQIAELAQTLQNIRSAISTGAMVLCFGIAAVCILLLFVLNRKWVWYPLRKIGFTMIFAALPLLVPTIIVIAMADFWTGLFLSAAVVGTVMAMILTMTAPVCMGAAGLGVVCIIASIIVKAVAKKRVKAAAEAEVVEAPVVESVPEVAEETVEAPAEEVPAEEVPTEEVTAE